MRTFKFFNKERVRSTRIFVFGALGPRYRNIVTKGYYDAFDAHTHGHDLISPYNPLVEEFKYELWLSGVERFQENNNANI